MKTTPVAAFLLLLASVLAPVAAQAPVEPGPEHTRLTAKAGTWDAVIEAVGPDGSPMQSKGVSTLTSICGGLWITDDFEAEFGGSKFHGHGVTGYDATKGKYVGTWVDSMSTSVMALEGSFDQAGKVLTMTGMAPGMDGKPVQHRLVTTHKAADTTVFEMFVPGPDGKEIKVMTITYTRRAAKPGEKPAK